MNDTVDPNEKASEDFENRQRVGLKFDKEKLKWNLLPLGPIRSVIKVLMFGAEKYSKNNWKYVPQWRDKYWDAAMRHLTDWYEGEEIDSETGESHLAHALCCLIFLHANTVEENKNKVKQTEDLGQ